MGGGWTAQDMYAAHSMRAAASLQSWQMMQQQQAYMNMYAQQQVAQQSMTPQTSTAAPVHDSTVEYEGSLKSVSARNGYGFIVCAATSQLFGRDVYIDKETLPEGSE